MPERLRLSQRLIDRYRDALTVSHRRFDTEARPKIEVMRRYLLGDQWPTVATNDRTPIQRLVVNLIFADIKVMLPSLALRNPRVFVKPTAATVQIPQTRQDPQTGMPIQGPPVPAQIVNGQPVPVLAAAKAQEARINWLWRDLRLTRQVRRCLVDALTAPFGIMKLGYTLETEKVSLDEDGELLEVNELIKGESPYAVRWSPLDFRVDCEARYPDLSDASWVAFGWLDRVETVQKNPRYKNTRDLKPTVDVKTDWSLAGSTASDYQLKSEDQEDYRRVQLWEIWDKRTHKRLVLADDHDKALEYVDWPLAHRGFPVKTLVFTEHPDRLYGPPDLWHVIPQQDAYNEVASMILNHVKRFLRKYVVVRGTFDEKELQKLLEPVDGTVVEIDGKIAESIGPVPDAPIPTDWWQTRVNFREDHDRVSGVADFMRGAAEKVDTATEASLLQSNLNVRTNDTRDVVETFAEQVATELMQIDAQTINLPASVPVIGPDGALAMGQFLHVQSRETLLAETAVEVEVGSMQPINQLARKKDIVEVYALLRNDPLVDQIELRKRLLPAYRDSIPDLDRVLLSREQAAVVLQRMTTGGAAPGAPPSAPTAPRPTAARPSASPMPRPRPGPARQPAAPRPPIAQPPGGTPQPTGEV